MMKNLLHNISYYIGCFFIVLSKLISGLRIALLILITMGIIMGVFLITLIGFFDLIIPDINTFGKVYWDIIAVVIGGSTMWFGVTKMFENDKPVKYENN